MKYTYTYLLLFIVLQAVGQINDTWIYGTGAAIKFLEEEVIGYEVEGYSQLEGGAVISDENGNAYLISDGRAIYRADGLQIAEEFELSGGLSSTNSSAIVPVPGSTTSYYVISTNDLTHPTSRKWSRLCKSVKSWYRWNRYQLCRAQGRKPDDSNRRKTRDRSTWKWDRLLASRSLKE